MIGRMSKAKAFKGCRPESANAEQASWPITVWDNAIIIHLSGEIDMHNAMTLRKDLSSYQTKNIDLVVDFSALDFIDSAGLAVLVSALNAQEKHSNKLYISGAKGSPRQVLHLTRLDQVFTMIDSPFQAGLIRNADSIQSES